MHHQSHVLFVYSHAESRGGNDYLHPVCHECLLVGCFLVGSHASVEWQGRVSVARESFGQLLGSFCARHVYYGWACRLGNERSQF